MKLKPSMQADKKKTDVEALVEKAHLKVRVGDVHMAKNDTHYRNKVIVGFAKEKGKVYSGLYAPHSHRVVKTENCIMQPKLVNEIINKITELVGSMKLELYNERTGTGLLRHVLIRWGHKTDEVMVVFVTSQKMFPSRKNMVRVLTSEFSQIKTIVQNINPRKTSIVLQDEAIVLYGNGMIHDELCGLDIAFSHNSFYQIHSEQCEVLYGLAKKMLDLKETDTVLDTYCGVGTISLFLAKLAKEVYGVEIIPEAIEDARNNAKLNNIKNATFFVGKAEEVVPEYYENQRKQGSCATADVIVVDPPRKGCDERLLATIIKMQPQKVVYVSCDSATLARDLKFLCENGYELVKVQPVDMFAHSVHVETVVLLSQLKQKPDDYINVTIELDDMDITSAETKATYDEIKKYVSEHNAGMKVSNLYISQVKRKCGIEVEKNLRVATRRIDCLQGNSTTAATDLEIVPIPNLPKNEDSRQPQCPEDKERAIVEALEHFKMIQLK